MSFSGSEGNPRRLSIGRDEMRVLERNAGSVQLFLVAMGEEMVNLNKVFIQLLESMIEEDLVGESELQPANHDLDEATGGSKDRSRGSLVLTGLL